MKEWNRQMSIRFDHIYTMDKGHKFMKKLEKAGFTLAKMVVEHPGKHICRFIYIKKLGLTGKQYMEFVHVGKGGIDYGNPGLSLASDLPLLNFDKKLKSQGIKTDFSHKNYEWKKDSVSKLPGWNFVSFPKHKSKIFTWITEYEYSAKRHKKRPFLKNKNGINEVVGITTTLSSADIKLFSKLFGKPKNGMFLVKGFEVHFIKAKESTILDLIFEVKDLKKYINKFEWDELTTSHGRPAVRIKNNTKNMWNVVIR